MLEDFLYEIEPYVNSMVSSKAIIIKNICERYKNKLSNNGIYQIYLAYSKYLLNDSIGALKILNSNSLSKYHNADYYAFIALCYTSLMNIELSKEYYLTAISLDSDNILGNLGLGEIFYNNEEYMEAIEHLEIVLKQEDTNLKAIKLLGNSYYRLGRLIESERLFNKLCIMENENGNNFALRGMAKRSLSNTAGAIADFRQAIKLSPLELKYYLTLAEIYRENSMNLKLKSVYHLINARFINAIEGLVGITFLYLKDKNYERAQWYIDKAIEIKPNNVMLYYYKVLICEEAEQEEMIYYLLDHIKKLEGETNKYKYYLARHLYLECDFKEALDEFDKIDGEFETNVSYYKGTIYYEIGEYEKSIEILESFILKESKNVHAYRALGLAYYKVNNMKKARENYFIASEDETLKSEMYNAIALTYDINKEIDLVIKYLKLSIDYNFNYEIIPYHNLGAVYYDMEDYDKAQLIFEKSLYIDKYNLRTIFYLGKIYAKLQIKEKAIKMLESYINIKEGKNDFDFDEDEYGFIAILLQCYEDMNSNFNKINGLLLKSKEHKYIYYYLIGSNYYHHKEYDAAVKYYDLSLELCNEKLELLVDKALCLLEANRLTESLEVCIEIKNDNPQYYKAYILLAIINKKLGNIQEAVAYCRSAIILCEKNNLKIGDPYALLALCIIENNPDFNRGGDIKELINLAELYEFKFLNNDFVEELYKYIS